MMHKEGGTNQFVDLSILHHFLCSLVHLKAVNHALQENFWSCQCAQYSPCNSISGLNIWDMIRYKSYDISLTCPHQWTSCPRSPMVKGQNQRRVYKSCDHPIDILFPSSIALLRYHHHFFMVLTLPLLSLHCHLWCPGMFPPSIHIHSWMGLF